MVLCSFFHAEEAKALSEKELKPLLEKVLKENPQIIFDIMQENPEILIKSISQASEDVRALKLEKDWQNDVKNPKTFALDKRPFIGKADAPNVIVGFSDFLCSYCAQSAKMIESLVKERNDIKFVFKASPQSPLGHDAARWFFYLFQENPEKAWLFHDVVFNNQQAYASKPKEFLEAVAKQLGYDAKKLTAQIEANKAGIDALIKQDEQEAAKHSFDGTPYFVINNVVLRGAYPKATFIKALEFSNKTK